jgi:hypothetical protein
MKKFLSLIIGLLIAVNSQMLSVNCTQADDFTAAVQDTVDIVGNNSNTMTLDLDNTGGDVILKFGATLGKILKWDSTNTRFDFNDITALTDVLTKAQGDLRLGDADTSNFVALQAPATVTSNVTWTLPATDGTGGQVLSTNGTGTLSWATAGASPTLQNAYTGGATITTASSTPITFTLTSGGFTVGGAGATTLGNNTGTVAVDSTSWDISTAGVASGLTGLTSTGTVSLGNNTGTAAVDSTSWDISTAGVASGFTGITSSGTINFTAGMSASGATINLNANSNFATNINTTASTGAVTIGNSAAGAVSITSGAAFTLAGGAASTISTTAGNVKIQPAGTGTISNVQIGEGGAGSTTPDYFALDVKSTTGDPAGGAEGYMYYNTLDNKFRCFENADWKDCDTTGGTTSLQTSYNNGATITTASSTPIAFTLTSGGFNVTGAGATSIGNNTGTVAVDSTSWDISTAGVASGFTGITSANGTISLNNNSAANTTSIGTGTTSGTVSIGGNADQVAIDSSIWDITGAGVASGLTGLTSTGTVSLGNNTGTLTFDGTNFDVTSAGAVTLTGHMTLSGDAGEGLSGGGLSSCNAANQSLKWNSTTNKFECATNGNNTETFTDTTPLATMADNNTSEVFTGTIPSITTSTDTSRVLVTFMVRGTAADNDYESNAFQVARDTAAPSCPTNTVGEVVTGNSTDAAVIWTATGTFLDTPGNAGTYYYQVCTNSLTNTGNDTDATLNSVSITLMEVGD